MKRNGDPTVTPLSFLNGEDTDQSLNGMPDQADIEAIIILKEAAEERLKTLPPDSSEAHKIRVLLGEVLRRHAIADVNYECSNRPSLREGRHVA